MHALNCRTIKVTEYTPSQLLIDLNPARQIWDLNPKTTSHFEKLESYVQEAIEGVRPLPGPGLRLVALGDIRPVALNRLFKANKSIIHREARKRREKGPRKGDLVLLQRFSTN